jgi:hypothetical protein
MKGAMADPAERTISTPNTNSTIISGKSQNFFLTFKKAHNSRKNSMVIFFIVS